MKLTFEPAEDFPQDDFISVTAHVTVSENVEESIKFVRKSLRLNSKEWILTSASPETIDED